jgi:hypothetical protein
MRRTIVKPCSSTSIFEGVAETFFGQRLAILAADERQLSRRPSIKRPLQDWQDRNADEHLLLALFGAQRDQAITHMLPTECHGITAL